MGVEALSGYSCCVFRIRREEAPECYKEGDEYGVDVTIDVARNQGHCNPSTSC